MTDGNQAIELAALGSQIAEVGIELAKLKSERKTIDEQISTLESKILPLIKQHSGLLTGLVGSLAAPPAPPPIQYAQPTPAPMPQYLTEPSPQPQPMMPPTQPMPAPQRGSDPTRERIKAFLRTVDQSVSAMDIADALKIDSSIVRDVLREMMHNRG